MYRSVALAVILPLMLGVLGLSSLENTLEAQVATATERKTIWDGVYTEAQAAAGQAPYQATCARCHAVDMSGGGNDQTPPLAGEEFVENWREDNLGSLYHKMSTTMPRRTNLKLSDHEYFDIVVYILKENGFPTGSTELTPEMLSSIWIQRKDGPQPLPNLSILNVVGCLAQDGTNWTLTMGGNPTRLRSSSELTPEDIKAAETKPLGNLILRLQNFTMLGAFKPEDHKGHKMLAQGVLMKQGTGQRLSLTALEMVSGSCGQ